MSDPINLFPTSAVPPSAVLPPAAQSSEVPSHTAAVPASRETLTALITRCALPRITECAVIAATVALSFAFPLTVTLLLPLGVGALCAGKIVWELAPTFRQASEANLAIKDIELQVNRVLQHNKNLIRLLSCVLFGAAISLILIEGVACWTALATYDLFPALDSLFWICISLGYTLPAARKMTRFLEPTTPSSGSSASAAPQFFSIESLNATLASFMAFNATGTRTFIETFEHLANAIHAGSIGTRLTQSAPAKVIGSALLLFSTAIALLYACSSIFKLISIIILYGYALYDHRLLDIFLFLFVGGPTRALIANPLIALPDPSASVDAYVRWFMTRAFFLPGLSLAQDTVVYGSIAKRKIMQLAEAVGVHWTPTATPRALDAQAVPA